MSNLVSVYPFQWNYGDEKDKTKPFTRRTGEVDYRLRNVIRIWGWNQKNESVCVRIEDFMVPMWIELPTATFDTNRPMDWTEKNIDNIKKLFQHEGLPSREVKKMRQVTETNPETGLKVSKYIEDTWKVWAPRPSTYSLLDEELNRLYDNEFMRINDKITRKTFMFIRISFVSSQDLRDMVRYLEEPITFQGVKLKLRCFCESAKLTPVMKLFAIKSLPSTNWITCRPTKFVADADKTSNKMHEYIVSWNNIAAHKDPDSMPLVYPKVCSFDIETYSSQFPKFPNAALNDDRILVIGCTFAQRGKISKKICLSLALNPEDVKENGQLETCMGDDDGDTYDVMWYKSEYDLMCGWRDVINKHDPDVLIGYNIFKFDITFMHARSKLLNVEEKFLDISCCKDVPGKIGGTCWESSARGKIEMSWVDAQGRLFVDLYAYIQANENLQSYKLDFVANKYLGMHKDPISPKDIFESWKYKNVKLYNDVIKYCAQDTVLPYLLFEKLLVWLSLSESATVNKVPIFTMVTQGQQIKAYSQVFDYCYHNNMVCNPPERKEKKPYRGAIVAEPLAGLYKMILPFDFASLYPSIIIAHNIDFSTFIKPEDVHLFKYVKYDEDDPRFVVNDNEIECFEWSDHLGCGCPKDELPKKVVRERKDKEGNVIVAKKKKKPVCSDYKYWFMKQNALGTHGVIPTIIKELLAARKRVRLIIEKNEDRIHDIEESMKDPSVDAKACKEEIYRLKDLNKVLDKRQLAFKVNANSMYGMYGAEQGYLPFFPGAETVTFVGRRSITAANRRIVNKHGGQIIYNDTDSAYVYFESQADRTVKEVWDFATMVVDDIASIFPKPMKLEFEGKIYVRFMIFTKKKYVAQMLDQHGKLKENMYMRGVPLVQRGYCDNMKFIYEKSIRHMLNNIDEVTKIDKKNPEAAKKHRLFYEFYSMVFTHFLDILRRNWKKETDEVTIEVVDDDGEPDAKRRRIIGPTSIEGQPVEENLTKFFKEFVIYRTLTKESYTVKLAHAAVADKIRNRGTPVDANTRIEYVLLTDTDEFFNQKLRQYEISEDLAYFLQFREVLRMDFLKYLDSQYVNFMNQVAKTVFGVPNVVTNMFKLFLQKNLYIHELKTIRQRCIVKLHDEASVESEVKRMLAVDIPVHFELLGKPIMEWANFVHREMCIINFEEYKCLEYNTLLCEQYVCLVYRYFVEMKQTPEDVYESLRMCHAFYPGASGWASCEKPTKKESGQLKMLMNILKVKVVQA